MSFAPGPVLREGDRDRLDELASDRLAGPVRAGWHHGTDDGPGSGRPAEIDEIEVALEVATGKITADACHPRHRHQEFLRFLKQVAAAHLAVDLHVVLDSYAAHKHPKVREWLAANPRVTLHVMPTPGEPG